MQNTPVQQRRIQVQRILHLLRGRPWFPHSPLALLLGVGGTWLLKIDLGPRWELFVKGLLSGHPNLTPAILPPLLIGTGMMIMALGLLLRSRIAWFMTLLLTTTAMVSLGIGHHTGGRSLSAYFALLIGLLLAARHHFNRSSITASTLFALSSMVMLLFYATFGSYYLGASFHPPITDLVTALYFAIVTMSTVGYGDISPQTSDSKLFTVSVVVLGVAVFATSLTAVIAPLISRSLKQIVNRKGPRMKREHHYVVIGDSPLANHTCRELANRGQPITRILRQQPSENSGNEFDLVIGDPGDREVLRQAGVHRAEAVLAMLGDDSENAFAVLAAKDLGGGARTVAAVNDSRFLSRIKLAQPDVIIAPQALGGELAAMLLCGEEVTSEFITQRVLQQGCSTKTSPSTSKS